MSLSQLINTVNDTLGIANFMDQEQAFPNDWEPDYIYFSRLKSIIKKQDIKLKFEID